MAAAGHSTDLPSSSSSGEVSSDSGVRQGTTARVRTSKHSSKDRKRSRSHSRDASDSDSDASRKRDKARKQKRKRKSEKHSKKKKHKKSRHQSRDADEQTGPVQLSKFLQGDKAKAEGQYSSVSGHKIKMKVDKSQADLEAERKRRELLLALNNMYD